MESVSNKSQSPLLRSPKKIDDVENLSQKTAHSAEQVFSNQNTQEAEGYKYKKTTFKQDVAIVFTVASLLSIGTYIAWRLDGCPPIPGLVKQLPPKSLLSN